ncbi:hypothetical protein PG999_012525 [Apiospora kogelbergensis]|uniref:Uncharacterized protein n=1 Tax=Apiospora kogelbergensis TaxID=1337665 RepID=A0AAW0Q9J6_9PEZI
MPKPKNSKKPNTGGGGGNNLPPIRDVLDSDKGCGTYRGQSNSISTVGVDLAVYKDNNPAGSGAKRSTLDPKTSTTENKTKFKSM